MYVIANTNELVADDVLTEAQAAELHARARATMVDLAVSVILCFGILAATGGLLFWLRDALSVAVGGLVFAAAGYAILRRAAESLRLFGSAAVLIGAGMLIGGASVELLGSYTHFAGWVMIPLGALIAGVSARWLDRSVLLGMILLMGLAMHLAGLGWALEQHDLTGLPVSLASLYAAAAIACAGWRVDVRLVTALAIVPFAQVINTGTGYFGALYAFWSPEPTLSILQMALLIGAGLWITGRTPERIGRHAMILVIMGFVVANLCALVGSLFGDVIGESWFAPRYEDFSGNYDAYTEARSGWRAQAVTISAGVYSLVWAAALAGLILYSAMTTRRGLFNAALTFAALHGYTQAFESFTDEPLAWVLLGLSAIPLAWGARQANHWLTSRAASSSGSDRPG